MVHRTFHLSLNSGCVLLRIVGSKSLNSNTFRVLRIPGCTLWSAPEPTLSYEARGTTTWELRSSPEIQSCPDLLHRQKANVGGPALMFAWVKGEIPCQLYIWFYCRKQTPTLVSTRLRRAAIRRPHRRVIRASMAQRRTAFRSALFRTARSLLQVCRTARSCQGRLLWQTDSAVL